MKKFGVEGSSSWNWENNRSKPDVRYIPAIIEFLGYNPLPEATTLAPNSFRARTARGLVDFRVLA